MTHIYLIIVAVVLAATFGAGWKSGTERVQTKWDAERAALTQAALEAERAARAEEQAKAAKATEVANVYRQQARAAQAAAGAARSELDRLRDDLASANSGGTCTADSAGRPDGTDPARELVGACATELSIVAAAADIAEARVTALQAWIREVAR